MEGLRQYIISVISAALICSILSGLTQKGQAKELIRLIFGLFLTISVIQPFCRLKFDNLVFSAGDIVSEADSYVSAGREMAEESMANIIKAESEAYILDKAAELNAVISVDVTVSGEHVPVSAVLRGEVSPYVRQRLETILETNLGITKESQLWTG